MAGRAGARLIDDNVVFTVADPPDWEEIWPIVRDVIGTGDTYPYPPDMSEAEARSIWMKEGPMEATFVARMGETIVATAYVKPNQPGLGDHVANAGWMVAPDRQGQGLGRRFAEYVIDQARERGYLGMQFNSVVSTNTGAVALWESLGFEIVGTVPEAFRHSLVGLVPIHVMYRRL
ncbi:MAG TPA: GNAT family N-acetyltransferase [Acidimicrobiia bacterium]